MGNVKARKVEGPPASPGEVEVRSVGGEVHGWAFGCPGCGKQSWVYFNAPGETWGWAVVSGDVRDPSGVSLMPSLLQRCCGWHGWFRAGTWTSC